MTTRDTLERLAEEFEREAKRYDDRALRENFHSYGHGLTLGRSIAFWGVVRRLREAAKEEKE